jgi:hypothetical protein
MAPTNPLPTMRPACVGRVTGAHSGVDAASTRVDDGFGGDHRPTRSDMSDPAAVRRHRTWHAAVRCASYRTVDSPAGRPMVDAAAHGGGGDQTDRCSCVVKGRARIGQDRDRPLVVEGRLLVGHGPREGLGGGGRQVVRRTAR